MKIQFTEEAWKDFEWFLDKDKRIVKRIRELLKDIGRHRAYEKVSQEKTLLL